MRKYFLIPFILLLFTSCTETFENIDPSVLNEKIAKRKDINSPEELIKLYYNYPENEGKPNLEITSKELGDYLIEITLIHDELQDDSQNAMKIILIAERNNNTWKVKEIKRNWKCWEGRGHTSWGIDFCS